MKFHQRALIVFFLPIVLAVLAPAISGQSSDQNLPTAVRSNEVSGRITALDLGDPRLTRHFYAFEATPGDLLITVNSRNLNGDVDVFTAVTFRPVTKISIYANTIPPEVTKSLYFRTTQILILRVEARTPNDDPGAYRITFGGSFQPFSGGIPVAENIEAPGEAEGQNARRLSSVGATIAQPTVETKPEETKPEVVAEKPREESATKPTPRTTRNTPPRTARTRPPRRSRPAPPKTEEPKSEDKKPVATEGEGKTNEKEAEKPAAQETPAGAHLIIEMKDGTRIDRPMSTVRRVIVEGNVIVVVLKTGRIERVPMSIVARMAIEP